MCFKTFLCVILLLINCSDIILCEEYTDYQGDLDLEIDLSQEFCSTDSKFCSKEQTIVNAIDYLHKYGYMEAMPSDDIANVDLSDALTKYQLFMDIEVTGLLDNTTIEVMQRERCSQPDFARKHSKAKIRRKRSMGEHKWVPYDMAIPELPLNWFVFGDDAEAFSNGIEKASQVWMDVANVKMRRLPSLNISYYKNIFFNINSNATHLLKYKVDAMTRRTAFRLADQFDYSAFNVTITSSLSAAEIEGPKAFYSFVHIWGHLLGLEHSPQGSSSVMEPGYQSKPDPILSDEDISDVQSLYGPSPNASETKIFLNKDVPDWTSDYPDLCLDPKIDSILELPDKTWIVFRGIHYFEIGPQGVTFRSPRRINWDFRGFSATTVDASLVWDDVVFLFSGNEYWKYRHNTLVANRKISDGFAGIPDGPFDDIFQWNVNQKTYFFKGGEYWKYDSKQKGVPSGYPKKVSDNWKGIPDSFDAALSSRYRNQTYFFKDNEFYRFDDINKKVVDDTTPPYPRRTNIWFLKCRKRDKLPEKRIGPGVTTERPLRPTPSYDNEPAFNETGPYEVVDDNAYWNGLLITVLIINILIIVIGIAVIAYLYYAVLKPARSYRMDEQMPLSNRPPQPPTGPVQTTSQKPIAEETRDSAKAGPGPTTPAPTTRTDDDTEHFQTERSTTHL